MSRLDRHVTRVRNKLAMGTFINALAWAVLAFAFVVLVNILVDRFLLRRLSHWQAFFWVGLGVTVGGALAYAIWKRPTAQQAATVIDERLSLKEKFSTALYVRSSHDAFAAAAVRDAEQTADNVSLRRRFPIRVAPMTLTSAICLIVVTVLTASLLGPHPLLADDESARKPAVSSRTGDFNGQKVIGEPLVEIGSAPALMPADKTPIEAARPGLQDPQKRPAHVAVATGVPQGMKEKLKELQAKAVQARNDTELLRHIGEPSADSGPLGDVQKDIKEGNFGEAAEKLEGALKKFGSENPEEQARTAEEMAKLAQRLDEVAHNDLAQVNTNSRHAARNLAAAARALAQQMQAQAKASQAGNNGKDEQAVADAKAQMQKQLRDLQDAVDAAADANSKQQPGENGENAQGNDANDPNGAQRQAQAGNPGTWKPGNADQHGNRSGGLGVSDGSPRPKGMETPVGFEKTVAVSVADDKGQPLTIRSVKTTAERGVSRLRISDVVQSAEKDAADEVAQDRISRPEQAVVKRYFDDLKRQESEKTDGK